MYTPKLAVVVTSPKRKHDTGLFHHLLYRLMRVNKHRGVVTVIGGFCCSGYTSGQGGQPDRVSWPDTAQKNNASCTNQGIAQITFFISTIIQTIMHIA